MIEQFKLEKNLLQDINRKTYALECLRETAHLPDEGAHQSVSHQSKRASFLPQALQPRNRFSKVGLSTLIQSYPRFTVLNDGATDRYTRVPVPGEASRRITKVITTSNTTDTDVLINAGTLEVLQEEESEDDFQFKDQW